jgi:PAS domain S-box-containing protein
MDEKTIPLGKLPVDVRVQISGKNTLGTDLDYRALFEQTGECVFIIGLNFKLVAVNQQALRLLGYEENQLIGLPLEAIMPLEDSKEREALLEKRLISSEYMLKKKDGLLLPVELSISVVENITGRPVYVQLVARDISERKQSEANLKRHMRALSVIGEVTAALFRTSNLEAKIPEVLESLGYVVDVFCCALIDTYAASVKVQAQWTSSDVPEFDPASMLMPHLEMLANSPEHVFSVTGMETGNEVIPFVSILVIPVQGMLGFWGSLALFDKRRDFSWLATEFDIVQTTANLIGAAMERLHYEKTIRLSEMRNRVLVDALPDLLLRIKLSGEIIDYSSHPSHPLYLLRESVIGMSLFDLWPADVVRMIIEVETKDSFVSSHWVYGFSLPQHDQVFEARLHPISQDEALVIVRDITEQAHLDQMKSDFINRASHELRTPLTSAMLMAELLQHGGTEEEKAEYLDALTRELNRQKELVDQLLLAGRLESGKMKIDMSPMDLLPALKEALRSVKVQADKRKISVNLEVEHEPIIVLGDVSGLSQVFINLINNAVKFSPDGKPVEVTAVRLGEEQEAAVSITDHGMGIPPDALPHLFERFYRARNVTVAEIPGSGIGLYIVKSIVDELDGRIEVKSELNQGTTFTVTLKLAD